MSRAHFVSGLNAAILLGIAGIGGCGVIADPTAPPTLTLSYNFNEGAQGWSSGLSDYPLDQAENLDFLSRIAPLPEELETDAQGLYIQSHNSPDDLFTFISRRVAQSDGVRAGQTYRVSFTLVFASNAPSHCSGVGGAPGESVFLKAGVTGQEPQASYDAEADYVVMNVDKGEQGEGGADASLAGDIANGVECGEGVPYVTLTRTHVHETAVTADADGNLWLLVGTDSGYESRTALYYQRIEARLTPVP